MSGSALSFRHNAVMLLLITPKIEGIVVIIVPRTLCSTVNCDSVSWTRGGITKFSPLKNEFITAMPSESAKGNRIYPNLSPYARVSVPLAVEKGGRRSSRFVKGFLESEASMGRLCDFCTEQRSVVYCRSDAASLCLSCDRNVHSANALSRRHSRTLLCDRCVTQPAVVRCIEENASLCQNCDWNGHGGAAVISEHKRQTINCYSGCPSSAEFSRIWSFFESHNVTEPGCEQGLMTINEDSATNCWGPQKNSSTVNLDIKEKKNDRSTVDKTNSWLGSSSVDTVDSQPAGSTDSTTPKPSCPGTGDIDFCKGDFYEGLTMGDVDMTFENYEELFGASHNQTGDLFDDAGIDSFFDMKENSATNSISHGEFSEEAKQMQATCSKAVSADSMMSNPGGDADSSLALPIRQVQSAVSFSFSGVTGESSAGDCQDCGMSGMFLMGDPPWCHAGPGSSSLPTSTRENALMRYKEKKKTRKFDKKIRYASRKARADVRRRDKGRFVKAGEAYDYDPLSQTRSY
ncbi:hypothetical protein Cni_G21100 [Canna indica]|uniref:Uncharacterized protein n=1 Tax=Canna indica TaxID=4628 RepID=A0AAQ3KQ41_9LILI|nr:hypothetical protein Cni_G21100 [Canna indica]